MQESSYPKSVSDVIRTLTDVCRHQRHPELVELLQNAHAYFDPINYDNWNGGTTTWALRLEVPVYLFASVQPRMAEIEKTLSEKLGYLDRINPNDPLGEVTITPLSSDEISLGQRLAPSDVDVRRLWRDGFVRLFLSHLSQHKVQVSKLKAALGVRGISAFVAHEDIEPSLEWQNEISLALRSMHALAALCTPDFHASKWTDQEVGWALGRGTPVIPVRLGADPYGFIGKIQGLPGTLDNPEALADGILQALLRSELLHGQMRRALVEAFEQSRAFADSVTLKKTILTIDDFTAEEQDRLRSACVQNNQISGATGVTAAIFQAFGYPEVAHQPAHDEVPF